MELVLIGEHTKRHISSLSYAITGHLKSTLSISMQQSSPWRLFLVR